MIPQIRASHILLMFRGSARSTATRSQQDAATAIAEIRDQITEGGDFALLAERYSDCPSSEDGGDLGHFGPGAMVPEFDQAAFALAVGEVSPVVETEFGYHLIKRTD